MEYRVVELETSELPQSAYDLGQYYPSLITEAVSVNSQKILFGAYNSDQLIGMVIAHFERRQRKHFLQSDAAIVHPDYQNQGIGFAIKQLQRTWALNHKVATITWSFDPLQFRLASFYFHRLGAISAAHIDSPQIDANPNEAISNQIEVVWRLRNQRVKILAAGKSTAPYVTNALFISMNPNNKPILPLEESAAVICVEVPLDDIPQTENCGWDLALQEVLTQAFQKRYAITDFVVEAQRHYYVLTAPTAWFLYVVECRDGSYYTGITPNPQQRLNHHNTGRGARYTASRTPVHFVAIWKGLDRGDAMRAEIKFKQLSRAQKMRYINSKMDFEGLCRTVSSNSNLRG